MVEAMEAAEVVKDSGRWVGGGLLRVHENELPQGLEVGDFIQFVKNFGDIFFEVVGVIRPCEGSTYWSVDYVSYAKYGSTPRIQWENCAGSGVRRVLKAEMAVPVMLFQGKRFQARFGQYDPLYGFAPRGTALRRRDEW